ncbi:hypothetical protein [Oceaniglobus ichthyenteri]|nr:hypothetical protein [Oceaniglobus ichthyenteri]
MKITSARDEALIANALYRQWMAGVSGLPDRPEKRGCDGNIGGGWRL